MAYGLTEERATGSVLRKSTNMSFPISPIREYGEWYGYLHRDGTVSHTQKGSLWRARIICPLSDDL